MTEPIRDRSPPEISEERVSRIWAQVSAGLESPAVGTRPKRKAIFGASLAAALLATALAFVWAFPRTRDGAGTVLSTRSDTLAMKLHEGSELELGSQSKLTIAQVEEDSVTLKLERGIVTCEVVKKKGRTFRVQAGDFEVRVVGTRFSVERSISEQGARILVRVEHGVVLVARRGREGPGIRISAGQTWSSEEKLSAPVPAPIQSKAERPSPEQPKPEVEADHLVRDPVNHEGAKATSAPEPILHAGRLTAEQAFEDATALRRSGQGRAAAAAYERFVAEFPGDPRAALAAFEKARLQMDGLGQPRAALSSLQLALRLSPRAGFREDVLARLVRVQKVLGQREACRGSKQRYLREYPKGVHREAVERLCSDE